MKKYIIYVAILALGLILGYVFFGRSSDTADTNMTDSEHAHEDNQMWTCSMHPQIMLPEPGDCPICGMDLIPAEAGADGLAADQFKLSSNAMALANIQTTVVGNGMMGENSMQLTGKIVQNEEANAVQVSYFAGRIENLNVNFTGEEIRQGQLLATIYSPELFAAQQELITAASLKESQPALYSAVRNKLKLWKLSDSQINQIETSGKVRENFPVYATVSGTVSEKLVQQGDYIKQGQPLLKIANLNTVWAMFDVYENQISNFKLGQKIDVMTNAYPNKEFKAEVSFIDPVLNAQSRTVKLRAELNNKDNLFKPGMFVSGTVNGMKSATQEVITIPTTAVLWTGERSVVYLKTNPDEPVFEMKEVTLGSKMGDTYEVSSGLFEGNVIVTNGTFTVDAAAQLQGKKSMMNSSSDQTTSGQEGHLEMENASKMPIKRLEVSNKFKEQLKVVFESYVSIDKALVNDDSELAKKSVITLQKNMKKVDMTLLKGDAHSHWMMLQKELNSTANAIANTSDIKKQREQFIHLSAHFINAVKTFGINQKVYVDFCPMANNNVGAYWLSKEKEILNPYFGQDMLTCGSISEEIE